MIVVTKPLSGQPKAGRFHWTVDSFYRAIDAGVFDEPNRLELIQGELIQKEPMNPPHATTISRNARLLRRLLEPTFWVREEKPIRIAFDSEPIPDIAVVAGDDEAYENAHPTPEEVRLLIEVADTTAAYDTGNKALLYARAGIVDYWVVLLNARQLWVFRNPTANGYASPLILTEGDTINPLSAPDVRVAVSDLLPAVRVVNEKKDR